MAPQHGSSWTTSILGIVLCCLLGGLLFSSSGRDDAYITYGAARHLASSGEIANVNGDRVEQSSSLLLVLLLAPLFRVFPGWEPVLGVAVSATAALAAVTLLARVSRGRRGGGVALLLATAPAFVYWATSGMEATLAGLLGLALVTLGAAYLGKESRRHPPGLLLLWTLTLAYAAVRPEAPLILLCTLGGAWVLALLRRPPRLEGATWPAALRRRSGFLLVSAAALIALLAAARWSYFGSPLPLPVEAKIGSPGGLRLAKGWEYLQVTATSSPSILVQFLVLGAALVYGIWTSLRQPWHSPRRTLATLFLVAALGFVVGSGGDWMESGRFLVPALPVAYLLLAEVWPTHLAAPVFRWPLLALLVGVQVLGAVALARGRSSGLPLDAAFQAHRTLATQNPDDRFSWFERTNLAHIRDIPTLRFLDELIPQLHDRGIRPVTVMSGQMGMVPYFLEGRFPDGVRFVDPRGLVERTFLDCPPLAAIPRNAAGLVMSYGHYFRHWPELRRQCGLKRPDVILDLLTSKEARRLMGENGYAFVYVQRGRLRISSRLGTHQLPAGQFVALNKPIFEALGRPVSRRVEMTHLLRAEPGAADGR